MSLGNIQVVYIHMRVDAYYYYYYHHHQGDDSYICGGYASKEEFLNRGPSEP